MLDKIEYRIAAQLADHHLYPYGRDIYINIFRHFSHFPIRMKDLDIGGEGETITFLAYVVLFSLQHKNDGLLPFYKQVLEEIRVKVASFFPFNITVETLLGCILFQCHPVEIRSVFSSLDVDPFFNDREKYEYELKRNTILIHAI